MNITETYSFRRGVLQKMNSVLLHLWVLCTTLFLQKTIKGYIKPYRMNGFYLKRNGFFQKWFWFFIKRYIGSQGFFVKWYIGSQGFFVKQL